LARTATMPAGKDNIISPDILTWHLEQQQTHTNSHKLVIMYHILTTQDWCTNNFSTSDISSIGLIPLSSEISMLVMSLILWFLSYTDSLNDLQVFIVRKLPLQYQGDNKFSQPIKLLDLFHTISTKCIHSHFSHIIIITIIPTCFGPNGATIREKTNTRKKMYTTFVSIVIRTCRLFMCNIAAS
jgi:hypothetical protein